MLNKITLIKICQGFCKKDSSVRMHGKNKQAIKKMKKIIKNNSKFSFKIKAKSP
jgi:hypothetical protein